MDVLWRWGIVWAVSFIVAAGATATDSKTDATGTVATATKVAEENVTATNVAGNGATKVSAGRSSRYEGKQEQGQEGKAAEQSGGQEFSISGMVVDAATGKPIGHALVGLDVDGKPPMRRVMTGEDGRFEIGGIAKAGPGNIEAWKPGYSSPRHINTDRYRGMGSLQPIDVEPGANVTIRLIPEATIAGQVVDENGEPIEGLPVELVFEAAQEGKRILREQDRVTTNEDGRFRLANLPSGRFFVVAGPSEEVASRNSEKGHTALGYPAEYYGGGLDSSTASAIDLTAGKHVDLDMRLALEPLFHVTGTITGNPLPGHPDLRILNAARQRVGQTWLQNTDREFQIALLPAGGYTIRSSISGSEKKQCAVAVKHLDLTRDVLGLRLAMAPCATIPVNVHVELVTNKDLQSFVEHRDGTEIWDRRQPLGAGVSLYSKDDPNPFTRLRGREEKDGDSTKQWIRNVEPGEYRIDVEPYAGLYVESVQSGLTDLQREDLVVAEGAGVAPIEVRLRDDGARLEGTIKGGDAGRAAVAIAIPEKNERLAKIAMSHDGKYRFQNLAPGAYRILAVDRVDDFAYAERDVMARYLAQSKEVNLNPNDKATADLEFIRIGRGDAE